MSFTNNVILSKTVILRGGWTFVRGYTIQTQKHPAGPHTKRSLFFARNKHSTPLFLVKDVIGNENFVKKRQ